MDEKLISDVVELERGKYISKKTAIPGDIPVIAGGRGPAYWHNEANRSGELLTVAGSGAYAGFVQYWDSPIFVSDAFSIITNPQVNTRFLYHWLKNQQDFLHSLKKGSGVAHVYPKDIAKLKIPVPPLEVQEEIVRILDSFTELEANLQTELEARRKQYEYYRNSLRDVSNQENRLGKKVEIIALEETCNISAGGDAPKESMGKSKTDKFKVPIVSNGIGENALYGYTDIAKINTPAVTIAARGTIGYAEYRDYPYFPIIRLLTAIPKDTSLLNTKYLYYCLQGKKYQLPNGGIPQLTAPQLKKVKIPVPPLSEQERIVGILDKFDALVNDLSSGLPAEIAARRKQYEYYRDQLLTFTPAK
ncbi:MAG: restriction endonuclease subunit S [Varibaculum cambriense]|uniref:restriction endonuclease subunit S n=1 Tax=Varibaculum cambriense TaxID=184870 RepID=UPI00290D77D1|nr:restriction endonuclease subunit S [Varibaculum cambriense]MDU6680950.1 restriction endonuclease subunit S [Varibaculum cambriense]